MIVLFDESEKDFTSLGLGVLKDAVSCTVNEGLNDNFELKMEYPVFGSNYQKIGLRKIIFAKPNPYDDPQPFRIYSISKPLKGIVTISANHISYDMNGIPVKQICRYDENDKPTNEPAANIDEALQIIQNKAVISHSFKLISDVHHISRSFKTAQAYNMRALIMGDKENSILNSYDAEIKFNKFTATISDKRGADRGAQVCYGYNMTDLKHEITDDKLYSGVYPYYHKETSSTETTTIDSFKKAYIVGRVPFQDGWLSFTKDGDAYHPLDNTPVQIDTEGEYYEQVYAWDVSKQKYVKKIYNESVTLIQGITEPTWIAIDWKSFPNIICRANAVGYFKTATDTDWGSIKGVGDIIFQGNVLKEGLTGFASNLIVYYSEVVPSSSESTNIEVTNVVHVELDNPIIKVNSADADSMRYERILMLDLTSEFDDEPTQEQLRIKAEQYISKNEIGTIKHTTTVSFVDLANTTEADKYKNFEHVELGDTVKVIYRDLGVDVNLRVISYEYNVLAERYEEAKLGIKEDKLSTNSIQNGDSITSLTNDAGYADVTTVHKLIAETITAEFLSAVNAKLTTAQIDQLSTAKIQCTGIIEASQYVIDELVATLLTAENAKIANTLEAGKIKVKGNVEITSGSINITNKDKTVTFEVDQDGNLHANSVSIEGDITATSGDIGGCKINNGVLEIPGANVTGTLSAVSVNIGSGTFTVDENGNMIATNIESVNGDYNELIANIITVKASQTAEGKIAFGDSNSYITRDIGITVPVTYTFTASRISNVELTEEWTYFDVTVSANEALRTDYSIEVTILYRQRDGRSFNKSVIVPFKVNDISVTVRTKIESSSILPRPQTPKIERPISGTVTLNVPDPDHPSTIAFSSGIVPLNNINGLDIGTSTRQWNYIYLNHDPVITSDRNFKKDIDYDISKYDELFNLLKPVSYKLKSNDTTTHLGFIAQDIEDSLTEIKMDITKFACLHKDSNIYGLMYSELHALEIYEIQKLKERIKNLEHKLEIKDEN